MIAALFQIGILRFIQSHTLRLASVWHGELIWIAVPVVAIKLHDDATRFNEGIDTKLVCQKMLGSVRDAERIQDFITSYFGPCPFASLLRDVHFSQSLRKIRVNIATRNGAVDGSERGRAAKFLAADFASVDRFIPTLPSVRALLRAEEILGHARFLNVGQLSAKRARHHFPVVPLDSRRSAVALKRAILLSLCAPPRTGCAAAKADNRPNSVSVMHV